jgi:multiple sugar transport system ATP-binding protein
MVFQDIALYPHMSVRENIGYGLKVDGFSKKERNERIGEAAEVLQIEDQLDKMPAELSGGQQQRVALGAAFVQNPDVLLLDEPMSDLDAKLKAELRVETQRLHKEMDTTMIYVTHDQTEAMTMSDYIVLMNNGVIAQYGSPKELFREPTSEFVSTFIGTPSTNILEFNTESAGEELKLVGHGIEIPLPQSSTLKNENERIKVGIRPQYINMDGGEFNIDIKVDVVEIMGAESVIHGVTDDGTLVDVVSDSVEGISAGDRLIVGFDRGDLFIFDSEGYAHHDILKKAQATSD